MDSFQGAAGCDSRYDTVERIDHSGITSCYGPYCCWKYSNFEGILKSNDSKLFILIMPSQGSELSPGVHYFLASLFREAGFPPGVVNFLLHGPSDGAEIFDVLIKNRRFRKCNLTGSTQVGQIITAQAAMVLKPVLLQLGGKNFVIVLDDANLDLAAQDIIKGAILNISCDIRASIKNNYIPFDSRIVRFAFLLT